MYDHGRWGNHVIRCKNDFNIYHWLESTRTNGSFNPYIQKWSHGWLWIGGNYPRDGPASAEPSRSTFTAFDVHLCPLSRTVKEFLQCGFGFLNALVSAIVGSRVINLSWILRCDADMWRANTNWHGSGELWPRRGCPTETGLPFILGMKRGDNVLYILAFLELLIIVRSALWPKNRFVMRCCFPITAPSTWTFCYDFADTTATF